jgi:hypothetical protein
MFDRTAFTARLVKAYVRGPVTGAHVIETKSGPAILFLGPAAKPPQGLPGVVRFNDNLTRWALRVFWEQTHSRAPGLTQGGAKDLKLANDQMWGGASRVDDDFRPEIPGFRFGQGGIPAMATRAPEAKVDQFQLALETHSLELPFWTVPSQVSQCGCHNHSGARVQSLSLPVPTNNQIQVQGVSYYQDGLAIGDRVRFTASVSGAVKAVWIDQVISASGDPTNQWALAGGLRPIPVSFIADQDNIIEITSEVLGPLPSGYPPNTAVSAIICLQIQAVGSKNNDARQGAPRPIDLGDVNDVQHGMLDLVSNFDDAELLRAVEQVLDDGAFGLRHPVPGGP